MNDELNVRPCLLIVTSKLNLNIFCFHIKKLQKTSESEFYQFSIKVHTVNYAFAYFEGI